MNHWATMLAALPATAQRTIARVQRVSLPHHCPATLRQARLRAALCRPAAVRTTFATLDAPTQAALVDLARCRGGLSPAILTARAGAVRPWSQLAADPRPQSVSERLVLLGWLLFRPATPRHPARYLLPPELRAWLPRALDLPNHGCPPPTPPAPAVRLAATLLAAGATQPLAVRLDGQLTRAALRTIIPQLAPLDAAAAAAGAGFVLPLLHDLGLMSTWQGACTLTPAGQRFLAQPAAVQLEQLRQAWVGGSPIEAWIRPLLIDPTGIDWPLLRRRLIAWAAALPSGHLLDPADLFPALVAAFGPLADGQTHGFRSVDRVPWQPRRAQAIVQAALHGPLAWLGYVAWGAGMLWRGADGTADGGRTTDDDGRTTDDGRRTTGDDGGPTAHDDPRPLTPDPRPLTPDSGTNLQSTIGNLQSARWHYAGAGLVLVPHAAVAGDLLRLLPFVVWQAADASATTYRVTPASLARAAGQGYPASILWELLRARAGEPDAAWRDGLVADTPALRVVSAAVVLAADPAVLDRACRARSVRRYLPDRLAPGVALTDPDAVAGLVRALARQGVAVNDQRRPTAGERRGTIDDRRGTEDDRPPTTAHGGGTAIPDDGTFQPAGCNPATQRVQASTQRVQPIHPVDAAVHPAGVAVNPLDAAVHLADAAVHLLDAAVNLADAAVHPVDVGVHPGGAAPAPHGARRQVRNRPVAPVFSAGELAALLLACHFYRQHAPPDAPLLPPDRLEARLRASLPPPLRRSMDATLAALAPPGRAAPTAAHPQAAPVAATLPRLRQALAVGQVLAVDYDTGGEGQWSHRLLRPVALEQRGDTWYLHAYCLARQAERVFRVDRIGAVG